MQTNIVINLHYRHRYTRWKYDESTVRINVTNIHLNQLYVIGMCYMQYRLDLSYKFPQRARQWNETTSRAKVKTENWTCDIYKKIHYVADYTVNYMCVIETDHNRIFISVSRHSFNDRLTKRKETKGIAVVSSTMCELMT